MSIASNLSPIGYRSLLPAGYTRMEFLESTGAQYINTEVLPTGDMRILVDVMPIAWNYTNYVFGNVNRSGANIAFSINYNGAHEKSGIYRYGTQGRHFKLNTHSLNTRYNYEFDGHIIYRNGKKPYVLDGAYFTPEEFEGTNPLLLYASRHDNWNFTPSGAKRIWRFCIECGGQMLLNYIPAIDPAGLPCMYDIVTNKPFYNKSGKGAFIAGVGTVEKLTALLYRLPATGGTLTLSLPAEANTPEMAAAMQACYDTKGWTLTVREYRPAATATYSLRRVREIVWCRVAACEHGSYANVHGVRYNIERCTAIYGAHGQDPTDYGYEPFDSVEQAAEEWGLTPYIAPDEAQA